MDELDKKPLKPTVFLRLSQFRGKSEEGEDGEDGEGVEKVGRPGLEPGTYGLKVRSSTIELATPMHQ